MGGLGRAVVCVGRGGRGLGPTGKRPQRARKQRAPEPEVHWHRDDAPHRATVAPSRAKPGGREVKYPRLPRNRASSAARLPVVRQGPQRYSLGDPSDPEPTVARLFWWTVLAGFAAALLAGVSWVVASTTVGSLLGEPPPNMGTESTTFLWHGTPEAPGRQLLWRFAFGPTRIPGAPTVRIYVTPLGRVVDTEPGNLRALLKAFHPY